MFRSRFSASTMVLLVATCSFVVGLAGCGNKKESDKETVSLPRIDFEGLPAIQAEKLTPRSQPSPDSKTMFTQLNSTSTGIDFQNELLPANMRKYLLNGAGLCSGDYDNDGLVDLYLISQDGKNKLYRQTETWKFKDVTESAGGLDGGDYWGSGAAFADVDGNGYLDLYVCNINGPNQLFINQGDGTFVESAAEWNADHAGATTMASFADYDNDGDLDLYLLNNRVLTLGDEITDAKVVTRNGKREPHPDFLEQYFFLEGRMQEAGQRDRLLKNEGGKFVDVTTEAGIGGYDMGLSATWWDFNHDGHVDLYVGNDLKCPDHLYKNLGNGKFEDVIADAVGHTPWFSMGADASDINNDGLLDFLIADMSSTTHYKQKTTMGEMGNSAWFLTIGRPRQFMRNTCLINSGSDRFWEAANLVGLDSTDWTWSIKIADQDCDGKVDVFFTNGVGRNMNDSDAQREFQRLMMEGKKEEAREQILKMPPLKEKNLFFRNSGDLQFENVADSWGANHLGVSNGCTVVDIDRDGDLDLIVSNMNEPLGIYRNDCQSGNRLLVQLNGTHSNRDGLHAMVEIRTESGKQVRQINLARGYMSADEPIAHFGVGNDQRIQYLSVTWPSGIVQSFEDLEANQLLTITEKGEPKARTRRPDPKPLFRELPAGESIDFVHAELPVDDYKFQPLLPNKLSRLGPGIAWADVNGDGKNDCFIGNGSGRAGSLMIAAGEYSFTVKEGPWSEHMMGEDMAPLFLDLDSDGDEDLLVISGGYEKPETSPSLYDHVYLNDGKGNFTNAPDGTLPKTLAAGSCAAACDFDRDGDLDVFIGTRVLPRSWPMATSSYLLRNDNGKLVDVTKEVAVGLEKIGLVTSGVWSDVDQDGWVDLLVTLEWGSVRLLKNEQGKLTDQTKAAGLEKDLGWWNSIAAGDLDEDGDIDFVVMNTGLNTKYHADDKHPVTLYAADFDKNGRIDLVESEWEGDKCFPIRGKSCSSHAMPHLNSKFGTFHEFALADLSQIYSDEALQKAQKFVVNRLDSVILVNQGDGTFKSQPLPRLAQISPGFGVVIEDFDGDGHQDICIAQNFMHPQPETGQMDGGMSLMLKGDGKLGFQPLSPVQSGLKIPGQGMAMTRTDLNGDGWPDLVITVNEDATRTYLNQASSERQPRSIRLRGEAGNRFAIGARVVVETRSGKKLTFETCSGSGYLSQSTPDIFVAESKEDLIQNVIVHWPNGKQENFSDLPDTGPIVLTPSQ